jgi:hypothetical protein
MTARDLAAPLAGLKSTLHGADAGLKKGTASTGVMKFRGSVA